MPCYHPTPALQASPGERLKLWPPKGEESLWLGCGKCLGCRSDRALEWSYRAQHEASQWRFNSFVTLTYDDEHCPDELQPKDLQKWFKRLRWHVSQKGDDVSQEAGSLRYLACGEYGERTDRPHYHVLLFNCGFPDRLRVGKEMYESPVLSKTWEFGSHRFGDASVGSAATYIAKYALKAYEPVCDADGVVRQRPFLVCSKRPAIGAKWLESFRGDLTHGYVVVDGQPRSIPRYYKKVLKRSDGQLHDTAVARACASRVRVGGDHSHPDRLRDSEMIHMRRAQLLSEINDVPF